MRNIFRNKLCAWDVDFIDGRLLPAWTMNWYKNIPDRLKELTKRLMKTYVNGEFVSINDAVESEPEPPKPKDKDGLFTNFIKLFKEDIEVISAKVKNNGPIIRYYPQKDNWDGFSKKD